jgi:hypothetical protein
MAAASDADGPALGPSLPDDGLHVLDGGGCHNAVYPRLIQAGVDVVDHDPGLRLLVRLRHANI